MAGMYAVYHGPEGLKAIATRVHRLTAKLAAGLNALGFTVEPDHFFDTITVNTGKFTEQIHQRAVAAGINLRHIHTTARPREPNSASPSTRPPPQPSSKPSGPASAAKPPPSPSIEAPESIPTNLQRTSPILTHPVFNQYHSETEILRYMRRLADRDLALDRAMIPLGSCTMKLNATTEMLPVTWPEFGNLHPFVPAQPGPRLRRDDRRPRAEALRHHRLRRLLLPAQLRRPGRVRRPPRHRRLPSQPRPGPPQHLPHPHLRPRHQPRLRPDGRHGSRRRPLRRATATSTSKTSAPRPPSTQTSSPAS